MLDSTLKEQLKGIFSELNANYTLHIEASETHPKRDELVEMLNDVAESSPKIEVTHSNAETLQFTILKDGEPSSITFRAVTGGHEFTSLLLAILNLDGKGKNMPDEFTTRRIQSLNGEIDITTYMSLVCTNCPDVVQAINVISILNPRIKHTIIDGALFQEQIDSLGIQSVPTVYADGQTLSVGRTTLSSLLDMLETKYGAEQNEQNSTHSFDVTVAGGGAAGATAAIYLARKGLNVAVITEHIGGQLTETSSIENIPSIIETTGSELSAHLKEHMTHYPITILENREIESIELVEGIKRLRLKGGQQIESPLLVIATGAEWRRLGIEGEAEYIGRGVAFCPHCDAPLFKGKRVAVIGGGNSGVEAAIELSAICKSVVLVEFLEELKADKVLQDNLRTIANIEIVTNHQTTKIEGDGTRLTSITIADRATTQSRNIELDGVFVQIGLKANSSIFEGIVELNKAGEIVTDKSGRTSAAGIYAAGDVTDVSYKQIVIAMGEGAKAALAAFDDKIRGVV